MTRQANPVLVVLRRTISITEFLLGQLPYLLMQTPLLGKLSGTQPNIQPGLVHEHTIHACISFPLLARP